MRSAVFIRGFFLILILAFALSFVYSSVPVINSVILNSTNPLSNNTNQNLTIYVNASDPDGDNFTTIYTWYKDNVFNRTSLIEDGLVSYYPFDYDGYDYIGSNEGILANGFVTSTGGKKSGGLFLNGTTSYVDIPDSASLRSLGNSQNVTYSLWFNASNIAASSSNFLVTKSTSASNQRSLAVYVSGSTVGYLMSSAGTSTDISLYQSLTFLSNTWYNLVFTITPNDPANNGNVSVTTYVNGAFVGKQNGTKPSIFNSTANLRFGNFQINGVYYTGSFDEIMIFNRTLSSSEISQIYQIATRDNSVLDSSLTTPLEQWKVGVKVADNISISTQTNSSSLTILPFSAPVINLITLNSTNLSSNDTYQNLTIYVNASDPDGDNFTTIYTWYKDNVFNRTSLIEDGLVSYYPFDYDGYDYIGSNEGSLINASINLTGGNKSGGLILNGSKSYVDISDSASLRSLGNSQNVTYSLWFNAKNISALASNYLLAKSLGTGNQRSLGVYVSPTTVGYVMSSAGTSSDISLYQPLTFLSNTWYNLVFTITPNDPANNGNVSVTTYVNGAFVGKQNGTKPSIFNSTANLRFGNFQINDVYFNGSLDDLMIFNRTLLSSEISQIYEMASIDYSVLDSSLTRPLEQWKVGIRLADNYLISNETNSSPLIVSGLTPLTSCQDLIVANSSYFLTSDVYTNGTCFSIIDNGISFNLRGYSIIGNMSKSESGIIMIGKKNITIQNGTLNNFYYSINMKDTNSSTLNDLDLANTSYGILLQNSSDNTIYLNTITNSSEGIFLFSSDFNDIYSNNISFSRMNNFNSSLTSQFDYDTTNYYDGRKASVIATFDDWSSARDTDFSLLSQQCSQAGLICSTAIITGDMDSESWASLQTFIDMGVISPASHSVDHNYYSNDVTPLNISYEVNQSKLDIFENLVLSSLNTFNGSEYLAGWIQPGGDIRYNESYLVIDPIAMGQLAGNLSQANYLVDRNTGNNDGNWSTWNTTTEMYNRIGYTRNFNYSNSSINNVAFDTVYSAGGIYTLYMHPYSYISRGASSEAAGQQNLLNHLSYIGNKTEVWYAGFSEAYLYHYAQDHLTNSFVTGNSSSELVLNTNISSLERNKYGLSYPITYNISIPSTWFDALVLVKEGSSDYILIDEKQQTDIFNGLDAVRKDLALNKIYLSKAFGQTSNDLSFKIIRIENGNGLMLQNSDNNNIYSNSIDHVNNALWVYADSEDNNLSSNTFLLDNATLAINNQYGRVEYFSSLNASNSSAVIISNNSIFINSSNFPDLNVSANITFYNPDIFGISNPVIFRDGVTCGDCINYTALNADEVIFSVTGFSNYTIGEMPVTNTGEEDSLTSSSGSTIYSLSIAQLDKGYTVNLIKNCKIKFNINNENHNIFLVQINKTGNLVTINFSSKSQQVNLSLNEEKKVDLDFDGIYDILIRINRIENSYVNLTLQKIYFASGSDSAGALIGSTEFKPIKRESFDNQISYLWFVVLVLLIVVYYLFKIRHLAPRYNHR